MTLAAAPRPHNDHDQDGFAPLTESQLGLLVVHRAVPAAHLYNVVAEVEIAPERTSGQIRAALAAVLAAQPALRTGLRESPQPHAVLADPPTSREVPLRTAQAPAPDFDFQRGTLIADLAVTAFDLSTPPLLRAAHLHATDGSRSVLLLVVHHTVFDGFSLRPLVTDFDRALRGELDVAALRPRRERALRKELDAQVTAAADPAIDTAAGELAEVLRRTPATVLNPRPNRPSATDFSGGRIELRLGSGESARIDRSCRELDINPFTFFSAVYAVVLARHSGNDSVVFGSPLMARRTVASYELCGFFVNTLPLVVDVPWESSFDDYVREVVTPAVTRARAAVGVPFNRIVQHAAPDRTGDRNPLFSCMLAMQDGTEVERGSAVLALREYGTGTAKFDLWLGVTPTPDGWLVELEHDSALLPSTVAQAVLASLHGALRAATTDPGTALSELFEDASRAETERADGFRREPAAAGLDGWLRHGAAIDPDTAAVEELGRSLTHRRLDAAVSAMAERLRARGAAAGDVVGLSTTALIDTIVTIRALLSIRACYLPIDLGQPADRISYMLEKSRCRLVVGTEPMPGIEVLAPVDAWTTAPAVAKPKRTTGRDDDGVYVMFTSGSTGKPKGVQMHNGPLVNLTAWQLDALEMGHSTRFLQYAPCGFDVSFQEIVPTLIAGGTVVSRDEVDRRDFPGLAAHVRDTAVTHLYLPVAALQPFVRAATAEGESYEHLTHLCVSGEQLVVTAETQRFFAERPHIRLVNLYGPTETHAVTTHRLSGKDLEPWDSHVPIGRPITGVTAQIIDRTGHLAPRGVVGELLLGGRCPAQGYLHDEERTDERFLPDPYSGPEGRRYRTGDQVMWSAEGALLFLGRNDDQVKIRGFRVELGEVEAVAQEQAAVKHAVAAVAGTGATRRLLLFLVADAGSEVDPEQVRKVLAARLPGYMVPSQLLVTASIPITGNGKVDRSALVARAGELARAGGEQQEIRVEISADPVRAWLQRMWAELLGTEPPGVERSLLEVGAHSLNLLIALGRIEQEWGVALTVLDFFHEPTVAALADALREQGAAR